MENNIKINVETEGLDEATEKVETLVDAFDGFPANVMIKGCKNCTFNIYPSQTKLVTIHDIEENKE